MKKYLLVGIIIGLLVGFTGGFLAGRLLPGKSENTPEDKLLSDLKNKVGENKEDLQTRLQYAHMLFDTNRYNEAIREYLTAMEIDPDNPDIMSDLGVCYRRTGQPAKAIEMFQKAVAINEKHLIGWYNIAIVGFYDLKDTALAKKAIEKVMSIDPFYLNAVQLKARIDSAGSKIK
jgi:tetratricopeptide (TPR) repeat protein